LVAGLTGVRNNHHLIIMKHLPKLTPHFALAAFVAGGLSLAGLVQAAEEKPKTEAAKKTDAAKTEKSPAAALSDKDKDFIQTAAKGGMMEVEMGKAGQKQAKSADVKKFATLMVTDHTKANNQLKSLAKKKGVTLEAEAPKPDKMDDATFDKDFMAHMVKDHEKVVAEFEAEAKDGSDADVKAWATKTLPTLKQHLEKAKEVQGKLK
jgi:putative membrane protein